MPELALRYAKGEHRYFIRGQGGSSTTVGMPKFAEKMKIIEKMVLSTKN